MFPFDVSAARDTDNHVVSIGPDKGVAEKESLIVQAERLYLAGATLPTGDFRGGTTAGVHADYSILSEENCEQTGMPTSIFNVAISDGLSLSFLVPFR